MSDGSDRPGERPEGLDDAEYIRRLEAANEALRAANAKLARERIGSSNTAAAGRIAAGQGLVKQPLGQRLLAPAKRARLAARRALLRVLR